MGCNVLCSDIKPNPELATYPNISYVELDELFSASDVVSLHAPLTRKTSYMINTHTIDLLKDGVYIINTSRGKLIETKALIQGLKSGKIGNSEVVPIHKQQKETY